MKKILIIMLTIMPLIALTACLHQSTDHTALPIGDLAFSVTRIAEEVYIKENETFVPFLVLDNNYGGNCLLLRRDTLTDEVAYNTHGQYGSYYPSSGVDVFLNGTYFERISVSVKQVVAESNIVVTSKQAIDSVENSTETITRKVFLLSAHEVHSQTGTNSLKEGKELAFFRSLSNRVAYNENGEPETWALRTPSLSAANMVYSIAFDGSIGSGGIYGTDGERAIPLRPAFAISAQTIVKKQLNAVQGKEVYVLN